ncbi:MAG: DNA primase [Chloroflexi bacterium]|nr:DNA primase [Chloroflexota bacterium]
MGVVDEIKQRLDIVEVVGGYVPLQKAGRNYKGLCPFHSEKTPSFIVFPDTQTWHCFGACGTGGDLFTFIMRRENLSFAEALRLLADRAGVRLEPLTPQQEEARQELDRLRAVNAAAAAYYHHILMDTPAGEAARHYLERRGVLAETMRAFQIGFAPAQWHALEEYLRQQRFAVSDMLAAGVLTKNESGAIYDRFRGRILFPVRDAQGQVIGFGGRALGDEEPKYLNTPETPLFDKGSALYGLDLARQSIRASGEAIVVEGYMDVIILHQCGVTNAVACMGTALTEAHIEALKHLARKFILALDADAAGLRAAERGVETAQQALPRRVVPTLSPRGLIRYEERLDAEIHVLLLPEGLDPDELILQDRARWDRLVAEALPVGEFLFRRVLESADLTTAHGKREAVDRLLPIVAAIDNPVERTHYLQRLAQAVRMDERQLLPALRRLRRPASGTKRPKGASATAGEEPSEGAPEQSIAPDAAQGLERRCLALLIVAPHLLPEVMAAANLSSETFQDARHQQIWSALASLAPEDFAAPLPSLAAQLDTALYAHVESLLRELETDPPLSPDLIREDLLKCSTRLRKQYLSRLIGELRFLQMDAQEQGAEERLRELRAMTDRLTRDYYQIDRRFYAATLVGRRNAKDQAGSNHV